MPTPDSEDEEGNSCCCLVLLLAIAAFTVYGIYCAFERWFT